MLFPVAKAYTPPAMHIASYYVHNWYISFAFQHDLEKCTKSSEIRTFQKLQITYNSELLPD
jgi:hypothetical protein